jgi:signal transduction histidine kinase
MKSYIIFFIFICSSFFNKSVYGSTIDSLENLLHYQNGKPKINTLNNLSWEYRQVDSKKAIRYAQEAIYISDSISYNKGKTTGLNRLGIVAIINKNFQEAENIYFKVLSRELTSKNTYGIGRAYNQLGIIHQNKGQKEEALSYFQKAQESFENIGETKIVGTIFGNIGDLYRELGNFESSLKYLLKSYHIKKVLKDSYGLYQTTQNIGRLYIDLKDYHQALYYLHQSKQFLENGSYIYEKSKLNKNIGSAHFKSMNIDSAAYYFHKSLDLRTQLNLLVEDADIYNNLGVIYYKKQQYKKALDLFQSALKVKESSETLRNIAHVHYNQNNFQKANFFYRKSLSISTEFVEQMNSLHQLIDVNIKLENYKRAIEYNNKYLMLRDSFENQFQNSSKIRLAYEQEKLKTLELEKNNEIALIEIDKQNLENNRKQILIYGLLLVLALLFFLLISVIQTKKQKLNAVKKEKERLKESQKVNELLQQQESRTLNAMILGQEEERKRIAQDLHDRLGGTLAMVKNHFKSVEEKIAKLQDSNLKTYTLANKLLDEACADVRKIAHNMYNSTLNNFGLIASIEDLSQQLRDGKSLSVDFVHHGFNSRLPVRLETSMYNIMHELIGNTLKHAKATELTIQLVKGKDYVNITVEDNGKGFDLELCKKGLGLKNIVSRVEALGGESKIDSKPNKGTSIMIDIPLNKNDKL